MNANDVEYPYQINNPTDEDRYEMLAAILKKENRYDDFDNIIDLMSPNYEIEKILSVNKLNTVRNIKAAVIGAGEAGLSAAFELRKTGCSITLFEAGQRIGGRVYTHYFDRNKECFGEFGPMSIPVSHETTWHYLNLFNIPTVPAALNNENSLYFIRNTKAINDKKGKSICKNIFPQFDLKKNERRRNLNSILMKPYEKYFNVLSCDKRRELIEVKKKYCDEICSIDKMSLKNAYENSEFSSEAIYMMSAIKGEEAFLNHGFIENLARYYSADSQYNYRIPQGMITLPYALYDALSGKNNEAYLMPKEDLGQINIKMGCPINGICESDDKEKVILKYTDNNNEREEKEEFDFVICAVPFSSLKRVEINPIFSPAKVQALNHLYYENANKIYLYLKERFWERGNSSKRILGGTSYTDLPIKCVCYPSDHGKIAENNRNRFIFENGKSFNEKGCLLAAYNYGQSALTLGNESYNIQINDVIRDIEKMHDLSFNYINQNLLDYKSILWSDVQYIWGAGSVFNPGDKSLFSYNISLPEMDNKIFFAGEHVSGKHMSQQGALQSGMKAAYDCAKYIAAKLEKEEIKVD